ncbi:hypothetical protein EDD22DRAFT_973686 [Suillus occidentalis]|nr:hypothetical protein EDD22DRAFT_973686 [Suillus occidentalis]
MRSRLLSVAPGSSPLENIVQLSSGEFGGYVAMNLLIIDDLAAVITFEHSFYIHDKRRHLQDQQESTPSFLVALEQYIASSHAGTVREVVSISTQAYQEAVTAAVYTYQGNLPAWVAKIEPFKRMAKYFFEGSQRKEKEFLCSQAKAEFIKTILEITLNHRLPRP